MGVVSLYTRLDNLRSTQEFDPCTTPAADMDMYSVREGKNAFIAVLQRASCRLNPDLSHEDLMIDGTLADPHVGRCAEFDIHTHSGYSGGTQSVHRLPSSWPRFRRQTQL